MNVSECILVMYSESISLHDDRWHYFDISSGGLDLMMGIMDDSDAMDDDTDDDYLDYDPGDDYPYRPDDIFIRPDDMLMEVSDGGYLIIEPEPDVVE
jgi:hypothetical protein